MKSPLQGRQVEEGSAVANPSAAKPVGSQDACEIRTGGRVEEAPDSQMSMFSGRRNGTLPRPRLDAPLTGGSSGSGPGPSSRIRAQRPTYTPTTPQVCQSVHINYYYSMRQSVGRFRRSSAGCAITVSAARDRSSIACNERFGTTQKVAVVNLEPKYKVWKVRYFGSRRGGSSSHGR